MITPFPLFTELTFAAIEGPDIKLGLQSTRPAKLTQIFSKDSMVSGFIALLKSIYSSVLTKKAICRTAWETTLFSSSAGEDGFREFSPAVRKSFREKLLALPGRS